MIVVKIVEYEGVWVGQTFTDRQNLLRLADLGLDINDYQMRAAVSRFKTVARRLGFTVRVASGVVFTIKPHERDQFEAAGCRDNMRTPGFYRMLRTHSFGVWGQIDANMPYFKGNSVA